MTVTDVEPDEEMNATRAHWAAEALERHSRVTGVSGEDPDSQLGDLLANLMHWADQNDVDFWSALYTGETHYHAERDRQRDEREAA